MTRIRKPIIAAVSGYAVRQANSFSYPYLIPFALCSSVAGVNLL